MMRESAARAVVRIQHHLQAHREFLYLLVLAIAFRLMAVVVFRPGGYLGDISTFGYYRLMLSFSEQGYYPLVHFWLEYPPVFPWIMVGLYRLSLLIPAWTEAGTWFFVLLSTFLALVEAGNLILFYAIARRLFDQKRALRLCWIYVVLLIPVATLFIAFDSLVLFFLLAAILLILDRRAVAGGIVIGLGFMTKLIPVVAGPAAMQHFTTWRQRIKYSVAAALVVLLVALPFLLTGPEHLVASFKTPMARASWETVWALIDGYYSFGVAGGWDRFDPAQAGAAQHPSQIPWLVITIGFGLLYLALYTRRIDWRDRRKVVAFTALTQNLLILYSKGYSPQFLVMLLPFAVLLIPGWRAIAYALLLSLLSLAEFPGYFLLLPDQHWLLAGAVLLRTLIVIVLSLEYAAQVYDWRVSERGWRRLAAGITALILGLGLVGGVAGFRAYAQSRYEASAHRPAMEMLKAQAVPGASVIVAEQRTYEEVYPFLHDRFRVRLVETYDYLPPWQERLAAVAEAAEGQLWLYAPANSPLQAWLETRYAPILSYEFDGWLLSGWQMQEGG
jgi:hypothetical protein